jgi:uncharacterized protein (TIGR00369 family)
MDLASDTAVWREPARGGYPDPRIFLSLSGLDQMRSFFAGKAPRPPIHYLTGMRPTEVGPGTSTFVMPATDWLLSPPGLVQLGTLAILTDGPLGCAVQTALPPATPFTTAELSISGIRPAGASGGNLIARGRLIHAGRSMALSEATVEDSEGRRVAHATSRCFIFPAVVSPPPPAPEFPTLEDAAEANPPPYRRPPQGEVLGQDVYDRLSGLEIFRAQLSGDLPGPPISHLTGLRPVDVAEGEVTFVCPATEWLCSPLGKVEGGVIALVAETPLVSAVQTLLPAGTSYAPLDLKVNFLRPVDPDGAELTAKARVIHRGKTIVVATSEVVEGQGRPVAVATGSSMVMPGRRWRAEPPPPAPE